MTLSRVPGAKWTRLPIARIEDLSDAVLGAGLEAVQMSSSPVTGSLAFATDNDITYSSGHICGQVALAEVPAILGGYYPDLDESALAAMVIPPALGADAGPLGAIALAEDVVGPSG